MEKCFKDYMRKFTWHFYIYETQALKKNVNLNICYNLVLTMNDGDA